MSPVAAVAIVELPRKYPHVDDIADWQTAQTLRLLWDRVFGLEAQLTAVNATLQLLISASNAQETSVATALKQSKSALASAQVDTTGGTSSGGGGGGGGGGPDPGDPGSQSNPIIAMSADLADIAASVRASRQFYGFGPNPADDQYWIDHAKTPAQFSNGKWYLGWNAYWHARASPSNTGSADPNLGGLPSPAG